MALQFLGQISHEFEELGSEIEDILFKDPQMVLIKARTYGEKLALLINEQEGIREVYEVKQVERVRKLFRLEHIEKFNKEKLDWLRIRGNNAAHNVQYGSVEEAIKAHRYIYDLSFWYLECYGTLDFQAPKYKLPRATQQDSLATEELETLLNDNLERALDEKLAPLLKKIEQSQNEATASDVKTKKEVPIDEYLEEQGLEVIDMRHNGGTLWVMGGWELKSTIFALKDQKIFFRHSKQGSRSTRRKPAWFLLNKNKHDLKVSIEEEKASFFKSANKQEKEISTQTITRKHEQTASATSTNIHLKDEIKGERKQSDKAGIRIVKPLQFEKSQADEQILFPVSSNHIQDLFIRNQVGKNHLSSVQIDNITEIKMAHLRSLYVNNRNAFTSLISFFTFIGITFTGKLAEQLRFNLNPQDGYIVIDESISVSLNQLFPVYVRELLRPYGIYEMKDLHGIPVSWNC
ncbi:hypothetical protein EPH95_05960 [Salicibibacter halophilus]|uniref:DUF4145 domain-containing protein n=1 Tax=Salicibibacter halophilus TaxID=2502791 RepID=A0A514LFZ9_9BACI|nr:hypothetical protein [Salicibibacter halophilus]QDI90780.1 hypothetical protein EPH95_05960 [Salicibibacter halophilus]